MYTWRLLRDHLLQLQGLGLIFGASWCYLHHVAIALVFISTLTNFRSEWFVFYLRILHLLKHLLALFDKFLMLLLIYYFLLQLILKRLEITLLQIHTFAYFLCRQLIRLVSHNGHILSILHHAHLACFANVQINEVFLFLFEIGKHPIKFRLQLIQGFLFLLVQHLGLLFHFMLRHCL